MHPLIADGGEMTVLRDLAAFSYGRWSVDWPESVPDEQRPELPDDRDFGYASKLKRDPGRFGRRFVRADVTIKAQDFDDAGKPIPFSGESDVEETLDDAAKRTDGDVFFEREITRAGLGALVPRVDFDVDSIVPVLIWGKTIPSPVASIEDVVEAGAVVDYRVHVGGQLLQDDAARERANREVEATIAQERRERVKAVSKERKARKSAIASEARRSDAYTDSVASGVESRLSRDFAASYERYSKVLTQLGDTWRQELQEGLSAEQQARVEALRQEQKAREKAGTDLRGQLEKALDDAVAGERRSRDAAIGSAIEGEARARRSAISGEASARERAISSEEAARKAALAAEEQARALAVSNEARARQKAISDLSTSFTTELQTYGELVKEAKNYVDPATQQVVNFWSKENQNNFNKAVQLTLAAQSAYNDVNNIKWVSQDAWNEQQNKINEARDKFEAQQLAINAQNEEFKRLTRQLDAQQNEQIEQLTAVQRQMAKESQGRIREIMATPAGTSDPNIRVRSRNDGKPGWGIKLTDMVNNSLFNIQWFNSKESSASGPTVIYQDYNVVSTLGPNSNSYTIQADPGCAYIFARWTSASKRQVTVNKSAGSWVVPSGSWTNVMSANTPSKTVKNASLRLKVTWAAATNDDNYGIRIRAGDRILKKYNMTGLGPATVFGDGEQWMSVMVSNATIYAGETIKVDVFSTATFSGGRSMKSAELTGTWIEDV
ncbi:hypothetical protein QP902_09885 [Corynebacterium marquesiae]|uniref:hypothetical protein n=1 Tax=Corynebacterium marquesiae TaxID=2913503 RepID=UPI00254B8A25|nr:hypothetical protein [Corynebacterium marquesiae]MDK8668980.1 hypothetical protein [Corynebacterium marquesiae]